MATLKDTPLRIPDQWSPTWFRQFVVEVLAKADARAMTGDITVSADGNSVANVSVSDTLSAEVVTHNGDPFAHLNAFSAHKAEADPHPVYSLTSHTHATLPLTGTGSPEGAVTAAVGTLYLRTDGGAGTSLYVKESGSGNTGWAAK